ncbi:MAG: hypothetical protein IPJ56_11730 [Gemmatimonadetes bacterium]|nr:hypothetical protein [Gemmatimonadota bacterium]
MGGSYSNSAIDVYDPVTDSWSDGGRIPTARDLPAVAIDGTKLYVVGGYVPCPVQCRYIGDVEMLDVSAGTWTRLAPLKIARAVPGLAVLGNRVYVVSGTVGILGPCW